MKMLSMKKGLLLLVGVSSLILSAACSKESGGELKEAQKINVEVNTVQTVLIPGRAILIDAHLTNGKQRVKDASKVSFEIWEKNSEKHDTITATSLQDGTYRIKTMFSEGGVYYVKAHVEHEDTNITSAEQKLIVNEDEFS
ncbi:FixH family protein [Paenibacillus dokdonensis]|uniref:FixH family protein n=1 Tax=Paenibacillus dokdonensis TaxID=2567944 RepID=A0ABU6GSB6_9BACL|nr:FixH family protein [Paenibacillus dokdonensis]MEC0242601.1 FixH family protein [Paenibacillus dokdonensis]